MSNASDIKELQEQMKGLTEGIVNAFQQVSYDYAKIQTMFFALLQDLELCETLECVGCEEQVLRPTLKGIPIEDGCPMCGENLFTGTQTTVDEWDSGVGKDESE
tara:strand:+ start:2431 stop:2742 length:312 start_codon:yes stop_codon:yes gene_type:complete